MNPRLNEPEPLKPRLVDQMNDEEKGAYAASVCRGRRAAQLAKDFGTDAAAQMAKQGDSRDALGIYLTETQRRAREYGQQPTDERKLVRLAKSGNQEALEILVIMHTGTIVTLAKSIVQHLFSGNSRDPRYRSVFADLIQIGNEAFIQAFARFNPDGTVKLNTYARKCIWGAMMNAIGSLFFTIAVPRRATEQYMALQTSLREQSRILGVSPSLKEAAAGFYYFWCKLHGNPNPIPLDELSPDEKKQTLERIQEKVMELLPLAQGLWSLEHDLSGTSTTAENPNRPLKDALINYDGGDLDLAELVLYLKQVIEGLSPLQRRVVQLKAQGLTFEEMRNDPEILRLERRCVSEQNLHQIWLVIERMIYAYSKVGRRKLKKKKVD
jgi:RNA polymerase sigma factor (sigma-70 family)